MKVLSRDVTSTSATKGGGASRAKKRPRKKVPAAPPPVPRYERSALISEATPERGNKATVRSAQRDAVAQRRRLGCEPPCAVSARRRRQIQRLIDQLEPFLASARGADGKYPQACWEAARAFLRRWDSPIAVEVLDPSRDCFTVEQLRDRPAPTHLVNGVPAKLLEEGGMNSGILFLQRGRQHQIVKLFGDTNPAHFLREILCAHYCELIGGPAVHGFGSTQVDGKPCFYLTLAELFPGQEVMPYKFPMSNDPQSRVAFQDKHFTARTRGRIAAQIAEQMVLGIEHQIFFYDPDFMMSARGDAAWVDSGLWNRARERADIIPVAWEVIDFFKAYIDAELGHLLEQRFFDRLDASTAIDAVEKQDLARVYHRQPTREPPARGLY